MKMKMAAFLALSEHKKGQRFQAPACEHSALITICAHGTFFFFSVNEAVKSHSEKCYRRCCLEAFVLPYYYL